MYKKYFLNFILILSLFAISFAYYVQYILGHVPCNLCILQRAPFLISIFLVIFFLIFKRFEKSVLISILILFSFGFLISIYHFGIEKGFFEDSFICDLRNNENILNKNDLLKSLEKTPISCKDVTFRVLGFSLATINAIISLVICVITTKILKNYENN
tara:strand:- start:700 stop:1173 length:474 start_codon:yes stop_codon:yes gene_type:complete